MEVENKNPNLTNSQKVGGDVKSLKPTANSLLLTPGKKTVSATKPQTALKMKPQTPKSTFNSTTGSLRSTTSFSCSKVGSLNRSICHSIDDLISKCPGSPGADSIATTSTTHDAREAAKLAKQQNTNLRILKVQLLKEKWAKEKENKLLTYKEKREMEKKKLQEDHYSAAEQRRRQLEKQRELEEKQKEEEKISLQLKHEANIQLKKDLAKEKQAKRRISMFLNGKLRQKRVEKEKELEEKKKAEEVDLLMTKRLDFLTIREMKKLHEEERRQSMLHHLEVAKMNKEKEKELLEQKEAEKQALLETRYLNWQDEQALKQKQKEEELVELEKQNEIYRLQKENISKLNMLSELEEISLLEIREMNWKDEQNYKKKEQEKEHNETLLRLQQWKQEKQVEKKLSEEEKVKKEFEFELNHAAYLDVQEYKEKAKEQRRQSLSYRLDKARKDRDYEEGQKALKEIVQEEERRIAELDRQDVTNYRQKIMDARRQSLEYRNQTEVRKLKDIDFSKMSA